MKKIKSKTVRDYVMNDMAWKVDLPRKKQLNVQKALLML